jgi:hypothetical protein
MIEQPEPLVAPPTEAGALQSAFSGGIGAVQGAPPQTSLMDPLGCQN